VYEHLIKLGGCWPRPSGHEEGVKKDTERAEDKLVTGPKALADALENGEGWKRMGRKPVQKR